MRLLLALGVLGGVTWISFGFAPAECTPVTGQSEIFCNRLWTPALFAVTAGFLGLRRWAEPLAGRNVHRGLSIVVAGGALMTFANFAEYWLFFAWPHEGPDGWLRGTLWMSFLVGLLALFVGAVAAGALLLRETRRGLTTRLLGSLMITAVSLSVFVGLVAIGILAIATSLYALAVIRRSTEIAGQPA